MSTAIINKKREDDSSMRDRFGKQTFHESRCLWHFVLLWRQGIYCYGCTVALETVTSDCYARCLVFQRVLSSRITCTQVVYSTSYWYTDTLVCTARYLSPLAYTAGVGHVLARSLPFSFSSTVDAGHGVRSSVRGSALYHTVERDSLYHLTNPIASRETFTHWWKHFSSS